MRTNIFYDIILYLGWFKLLPTFGGCVITVSKATMLNGVIDLEVDYTTAKEVDGLKGLGTYVTPPVYRLLIFSQTFITSIGIIRWYCVALNIFRV